MEMSTNKDDSRIKIGLGVWLCFCVLVSLWIFTRFMKGRQQLSSNLHIVEESLRRMQEKLEMERRKKSIGCVDTLDDITACLDADKTMEQTQQGDDVEGGENNPLLTTENEFDKLLLSKEDCSGDETDDLSEDKKNI